MNTYRVEVRVMPRTGLLDPQGAAVHHALRSLGWEEASSVRVGKTIHVELDSDSPEAATEAVCAMCRKLLANPVTEEFEIADVEEVDA